MKKPIMKGIEGVSDFAHRPSDTKRGTGEKGLPVAAHLAACLLVIGLLLPANLCPAAEQNTAEAAIAADLAAGVEITVIIQNAVAAGLSVENAVAVLVTAGANPGVVVNAAIGAGFSAPNVVQGASNAIQQMGLPDAAVLTQMTTIVQAATQAGATPAQVNSGFSNAGVSPTVIANANTNAASTPPPVFGYTAPPTTAAPATAVVGAAAGGGGGGGLIGGGAIGAQPTEASGNKPASPTQPLNQP